MFHRVFNYLTSSPQQLCYTVCNFVCDFATILFAAIIMKLLEWLWDHASCQHRALGLRARFTGSGTIWFTDFNYFQWPTSTVL